jgi:predicted dehydrogenase
MADERPLRLGVIGLGRRWQRRYQPALRALKSLFRVVAVIDQVQQRAAREADKRKWSQARGVVELIRHERVDAVLLADAQWYGLWPLAVAAAQHKPVFCGVSLAAVGDEIAAAVSANEAAIMVDLPLRSGPLPEALFELCAGPLGQVEQILCTLSVQSGSGAGEELFPPAYLDFCLRLLGGEPRRFHATGLPDGSLASVLAETADGRTLQFTRCRVRGRSRCRLQIFGTTGTAEAELPRRLRWQGTQGRWTRVLPAADDLSQRLLREFHGRVVNGKALRPNLTDAIRAGRWQRLALESWNSGLWAEVTPEKTG